MLKIELTKEYLQDRFIDKKWSYFQIYKETGWSKSTINTAIGKFGLRRKRNFKSLDLIGHIFGKLKVLYLGPTIKHSNNWICKCECGELRTISTGNLLAGNHISCGCYKNNLKGALHPSWQGKGKLNRSYWSIIRCNAERRGIYFDLTIDYIWELFEKQKEKCALTGWPLIIEIKSFQTASLDRIDSKLGYIEGNVQWVHKDVNKSKNTFSQEYFLKMCSDIHNQQKNF
jgi:hypothetical protein